MFTSTSPLVDEFRPMINRFCRTRYSNSFPWILAIGDRRCRPWKLLYMPPPPSSGGLAGGAAAESFKASKAHASLSRGPFTAEVILWPEITTIFVFSKNPQRCLMIAAVFSFCWHNKKETCSKNNSTHAPSC